jgi:anti-sigma B factor antagonist/serine/threonine-protein kinase RsbW
VSTNSTLHITATLDNLATIRRFVTDTAADLGVNQTMISRLELAVDEVATNIICHGYREQSGTIEIELSRQGETLAIYVRDQAPSFDPTAVSPPDLTQSLHTREPGGLGIYITKQVMDTVTHRLLPQGGNELILVKQRIFSGTSLRDEDVAT